jgi:hypothetical protein
MVVGRNFTTTNYLETSGGMELTTTKENGDFIVTSVKNLMTAISSISRMFKSGVIRMEFAKKTL